MYKQGHFSTCYLLVGLNNSPWRHPYNPWDQGEESVGGSNAVFPRSWDGRFQARALARPAGLLSKLAQCWLSSSPLALTPHPGHPAVLHTCAHSDHGFSSWRCFLQIERADLCDGERKDEWFLLFKKMALRERRKDTDLLGEPNR